MIRFASLGSGSKGNATIIESGLNNKDTRVLIDCGFSTKEVEIRLNKLKRSAADITAIVVTHEHSDHINGVGRLSRKYQIPVWMTAGTWLQCRDTDFYETHFIDSHQDFSIDGLNLHPFPVPHDAREPCQFVFSDGKSRLALATDLGSFTPHVIKHLQNLDGLLLECNYDYEMLQGGAYPEKLKQRVSGNRGHLDNKQATQLLRTLELKKLKHIVGMHISENNNTNEYALDALCSGLNSEKNAISLASQQSGFDWLELN